MKNKVTTIVILVITVVLAGVAIFTAVRLYQRGQEPVAPSAPSSIPFAWDCSTYTFNMSTEGVVSIANNSTRDEPSQIAEVYINDQLITTFEVPALSPGDENILGNITTPSEPFSWRIMGTRDCQNSGQISPTVNRCDPLSFEIQETTISPTEGPSETPSPSPTGTTTEPTDTPTITPANSPTPTEPAVGGGPTNTPVPTATNTPTPTSGQIASGPTATPTTGNIAQANSPTPTTDTGATGGAGDELPDSGFDDPITLFALSGILLMIGALVLAL